MKPHLLACCLLLANSCDQSDTPLGPLLVEPPSDTLELPTHDYAQLNTVKVELDSADLPSIVITNVGPGRVEFEVRNTTPRSYLYPGWPDGSIAGEPNGLIVG